MSKVQPKRTRADMPLNKYERDRLLNIEANKKKMESLKLKHIVASMSSFANSTNEKKRKCKNRTVADEDEDYEADLGDDVNHLDEAPETDETFISKAKKKNAEMLDERKRSRFIPPLSLSNFLKLNDKQRRDVIGDDAVRSVSSALKVVQEAIGSQQEHDYDSDDINNEEFSQFMALEREKAERQYQSGGEDVPVEKEYGETEQEEQGTNASDDDDTWNEEIQRQLAIPTDINPTSNEVVTSGKEKSVRGAVYCRKLAALAPGEKIFVQFNEDGIAIGENASMFAYFLGNQVRNRAVLPVKVNGWEDFKPETLDHLWRCVLEKCDFDNPELRKDGVMKHARTLFRNSRYKLKRKYIIEPKLITKEAQLKNKPKDMLKDDWKYLVELWRTQKFQDKSTKAKESRSCQKMPHYTGSKSHARVKEEVKQTNGGVCSRVDLLLETRKRKSKNPVNSVTLDCNTKAIEEVNRMKKQRNEGLIDKTDDQILVEVLGQDKHGYLRCYGRGKTITQYFGVKPSRLDLAKEVIGIKRTTENVVAQAKNEVLKARKEVEDIRKEAEIAKRDADAKVDDKIEANNRMWEEKLQNMLKSYGIIPSYEGN